MPAVSQGFPPLVQSDAHILILGSLPGIRSLQAQEYYAHPRNSFWPIMKEIFGFDGSYAERCAGLVANRIALWDVLRASVRPGSLDADIRLDTASANDFISFLGRYPAIERIAFNGKKAEQLFRRLVTVDQFPALRLNGLPSTSPAYAAMPFSVKLQLWEKLLTR